jgi:hypothetical protein
MKMGCSLCASTYSLRSSGVQRRKCKRSTSVSISRCTAASSLMMVNRGFGCVCPVLSANPSPSPCITAQLHVSKHDAVIRATVITPLSLQYAETMDTCVHPNICFTSWVTTRAANQTHGDYDRNLLILGHQRRQSLIGHTLKQHENPVPILVSAKTTGKTRPTLNREKPDNAYVLFFLVYTPEAGSNSATLICKQQHHTLQPCACCFTAAPKHFNRHTWTDAQSLAVMIRLVHELRFNANGNPSERMKTQTAQHLGKWPAQVGLGARQPPHSREIYGVIRKLRTTCVGCTSRCSCPRRFAWRRTVWWVSSPVFAEKRR